MKFGMDAGLGVGHIVLDWDPASPLQNGHSSPFSVDVRCFQKGVQPPINFGPMSIASKLETTGQIKLPYGSEIGLGPGDIVFNEDAALSAERGTAETRFALSFLRESRVRFALWQLRAATKNS